MAEGSCARLRGFGSGSTVFSFSASENFLLAPGLLQHVRSDALASKCHPLILVALEPDLLRWNFAVQRRNLGLRVTASCNRLVSVAIMRPESVVHTPTSLAHVTVIAALKDSKQHSSSHSAEYVLRRFA